MPSPHNHAYDLRSPVVGHRNHVLYRPYGDDRSVHALFRGVDMKGWTSDFGFFLSCDVLCCIHVDRRNEHNQVNEHPNVSVFYLSLVLFRFLGFSHLVMESLFLASFYELHQVQGDLALSGDDGDGGEGAVAGVGFVVDDAEGTVDDAVSVVGDADYVVGDAEYVDVDEETVDADAAVQLHAAAASSHFFFSRHVDHHAFCKQFCKV